MKAKLLIIVTTFLLAGCSLAPFFKDEERTIKQWMTLSDNESVKEALGFEEKIEESFSGAGIYGFIPVSSDAYQYLVLWGRISSAEDRALAIEQSFNARGLTNFDKIIKEFSSYHLPCLEDKNKLTCEYYLIYSGPHSPPYEETHYHYAYERVDTYVSIMLSFELLDNQLKVTYDDQSCEVDYDENNRVRNYIPLAIDFSKKFIERQKEQIELKKKLLRRPIRRGDDGLSRIQYGRKVDADIQQCLRSDLYTKLQVYFKTYYPEKYDRAHLGGAERE